MDNSSIHPSCANLAHLVDLHLWRGAPRNLDPDRAIQILVNHGYVAGFCPDRLQPAWSAYRVAHADDDVDYDRPLVYYEDMRLPEEHRIGSGTFGKIGGIQLNVGHMAPNEVINRQYGRLAQMETFFMSNMSPQYGSLNSGVWLKLENAIRNIRDEPGKDHVWTIVGPVFGNNPSSIHRGNGKNLPVPEAYFCVVVDPQRWPWDRMSVVDIDCFLIPQDAPSGGRPEDYRVSLQEVSDRTKLYFFPGWGREQANGLAASHSRSESRSRLTQILATDAPPSPRAGTPAGEPAHGRDHGHPVDRGGIHQLIERLRDEAASIQIAGRALTASERARLQALQDAIGYLTRAIGTITPPGDASRPAAGTLITYKIESDLDELLKNGTRTACNFWNRFVQPHQSVVLRVGTFHEDSRTIARAYKPWTRNNTRYGRVQFNKAYLTQFSADEIAGTLVHEIGHTLGIGWDRWDTLFDRHTGRFRDHAIRELAALEQMEVELTGGRGTAFAHWDEHRFDRELMTGYKDSGEHVLPVTIDVMQLFGHRISERLAERTPLRDLLEEAQNVIFSRHDDALSLDVDYFEETELFETIPHQRP